jgi:ribosomal subunit interface protein
MQMQIFFRDIGKTEALESYLLDKVGAVTDKFLKDDESAVLTVRVESDRQRTQSRKPSFSVEIVLKPSRLKETLKVQKSGEDFYVAVNDATLALRNKLRRRSHRKSEHGRYEHGRERDLFIDFINAS